MPMTHGRFESVLEYLQANQKCLIRFKDRRGPIGIPPIGVIEYFNRYDHDFLAYAAHVVWKTFETKVKPGTILAVIQCQGMAFEVVKHA